MAKETYYFSHDYNARNDPKLQKVLMKLGQEGKGVYWDLVETLFEEGGKLRLSDCDIYAFSFRCSVECLKSLINDFELFTTDGTHFWSESVLKRINNRVIKSEKAKQSASTKWGNLSKENQLKRSERLSLARKKGTHSKDDWQEMLLFFNNECVICGAKEKIVKDHIIPIYQEGSDAITNLQPLCQSCNSSKGADNTDHRIAFCERNACEMPAKYLITPAIKESKEKEIERKRNIFKKELAEFLPLYGREMLNDFYKHWIELNKSKTKMKFESEKTWELNLRLAKWKKISDEIGFKNKKQNQVIDYANIGN